MDRSREARLSFRPSLSPPGTPAPAPRLLRKLRLGEGRDGLVFVPDSVTPDRPTPVLLMLHGAGGFASQGIIPFEDLASRTGTILIAPESRGSTWDVIRGGFGEDVRFVDAALAEALGPYRVDPGCFGIGGFSDGASYALSLGLTNGDLFSHVIAFSPGFMAPAMLRGAPVVYLSHGTQDRVLPIDRCSRRLVPALRKAELDVVYEEFDGGHTIPEGTARHAFAWFLGVDGAARTEGASVPTEESGAELT